MVRLFKCDGVRNPRNIANAYGSMSANATAFGKLKVVDGRDGDESVVLLEKESSESDRLRLSMVIVIFVCWVWIVWGML